MVDSLQIVIIIPTRSHGTENYFDNIHTLLTNSFGQQTSFWSNLGQEAGIETVNLLVGAVAGAVATGGAGIAVTIGIAAGTALVNTIIATNQARQTAIEINRVADEIDGNFVRIYVAGNFDLHSIAATNQTGRRNIHLFESPLTQRIVAIYNNVMRPLGPVISTEHSWHSGCECWNEPILQQLKPPPPPSLNFWTPNSGFGQRPVVPNLPQNFNYSFTVDGILRNPARIARITSAFCEDLAYILRARARNIGGGN